MFKYLKDLFTHRSATEIVNASLVTYQRQLLACEEQAAYYAKMTEYYREGIDRISGKLNSKLHG